MKKLIQTVAAAGLALTLLLFAGCGGKPQGLGHPGSPMCNLKDNQITVRVDRTYAFAKCFEPPWEGDETHTSQALVYVSHSSYYARMKDLSIPSFYGTFHDLWLKFDEDAISKELTRDMMLFEAFCGDDAAETSEITTKVMDVSIENYSYENGELCFHFRIHDPIPENMLMFAFLIDSYYMKIYVPMKLIPNEELRY